MNTWLPPLMTGRFPTTEKRLLLAIGLMSSGRGFLVSWKPWKDAGV